MPEEYMSKTCGECRHLEDGEFAGMEAVRDRRCRERVHVLGQITPRGIMMMPMYPVVPPQMQACAQFQGKRVELAGQ